MKASFVKLFFLLGLAFIFSHCQKDKFDSIGGDLASPDTTEKRSYFTDTLQTQVEEVKEVFVAYVAKGHFFYVIQNITGSTYRLTKCTREIDTLYSKILDLGPGNLIQIKGDLTEDAFYTLTATNKFGDLTGPSVSAFTLANTYTDSTCSKSTQTNDYNYESDFRPEGALKQDNFTLLKKFNAYGKEIWSKEFSGNYFSQNAMGWANNGNLYLITFLNYPVRYKLNSLLSQSFPYYDQILDSNSCTIYALNKSGVILRKRKIEGIYNYFHSISPNLSLSSNYLRVSGRDFLYTLDYNLNLVSNAKPLKNTCNNFLRNVISNPLLPNVYVSGYMTYANYTDRNYYRVDLNGLTEENSRQNINPSPVFFSMNKFGQFYSLNSTNTVTKHNSDETILFSKLLNSDISGFSISKNACTEDSYGKLYCFALENSLIRVYKLDENGNF
ncbi:MAG: hypothetical protein JNK73_00680 [Bacteroidia bacterium]|nr:hypothetical protein [Bacteroidia bacterium]